MDFVGLGDRFEMNVGLHHRHRYNRKWTVQRLGFAYSLSTLFFPSQSLGQKKAILMGVVGRILPILRSLAYNNAV